VSYALFTIPDEEEWTIIFNSDLDHWGAYSYNEEYDVLRVTAKAETSEEQVEAFSIQFTDAAMILAWDKTIVEVPVGY
jgi:predicted class III extradiol MEMO1 family dioxygenase